MFATQTRGQSPISLAWNLKDLLSNGLRQMSFVMFSLRFVKQKGLVLS